MSGSVGAGEVLPVGVVLLGPYLDRGELAGVTVGEELGEASVVLGMERGICGAQVGALGLRLRRLGAVPAGGAAHAQRDLQAEGGRAVYDGIELAERPLVVDAGAGGFDARPLGEDLHLGGPQRLGLSELGGREWTERDRHAVPGSERGGAGGSGGECTDQSAHGQDDCATHQRAARLLAGHPAVNALIRAPTVRMAAPRISGRLGCWRRIARY